MYQNKICSLQTSWFVSDRRFVFVFLPNSFHHFCEHPKYGHYPMTEPICWCVSANRFVLMLEHMVWFNPSARTINVSVCFSTLVKSLVTFLQPIILYQCFGFLHPSVCNNTYTNAWIFFSDSPSVYTIQIVNHCLTCFNPLEPF